MLEHFFYGDKTISRGDIEELILTIIVREGDVLSEPDEEDADTGDADIGLALGRLIGVYRALFPDEKELEGKLDEKDRLYDTEKLFRDVWAKTYVFEMARSSYPVTYEGKPLDLKVKAQRDAFLDGGTYSWPDVLEFKQPIPRDLLIKIAKTHAGAEAERSKAVYDYFRAEHAKKEAAK